MQRRGFLGFLTGAVAAGPRAMKAAFDDKVLVQAGMPWGGETVAAAESAAVISEKGIAKRALAWVRKRGIPDWKMAELRERANERRALGLDPDLACLVSVSPGWKAREQRRRNLARVVDASLASIGRDFERSSWHQQVVKKFGRYVDWY